PSQRQSGRAPFPLLPNIRLRQAIFHVTAISQTLCALILSYFHCIPSNYSSVRITCIGFYYGNPQGKPRHDNALWRGFTGRLSGETALSTVLFYLLRQLACGIGGGHFRQGNRLDFAGVAGGAEFLIARDADFLG